MTAQEKRTLITQMKDGVRKSLVAARLYRQGRYVPGLVYDARGDKSFAERMWYGCMYNAHSTMAALRVLTSRK
jgi:hypothetical protein